MFYVLNSPPSQIFHLHIYVFFHPREIHVHTHPRNVLVQCLLGLHACRVNLLMGYPEFLFHKLQQFNISSLFTVQNVRTRLVKIDHVCFVYLATTSRLIVLLSTTY